MIMSTHSVANTSLTSNALVRVCKLVCEQYNMCIHIYIYIYIYIYICIYGTAHTQVYVYT